MKKTKIIASSPITSWPIDGEIVEAITDVIFLDSKIMANDDFSHKIKRCLLLWSKAMTNLDSVLKSRDITLPTKVHIVKAMIFPVVMYGCESWTIKKDEHWRMDAFKLWCWRFLRVPWTSRKSNQSVWKENQPQIFIGSTDAEVEAPIFWSPVAKNWLFGKDPDVGRDWSQKEQKAQRMRWLDSFKDSTDLNQSKLQEIVKDREV